eukprot:3820702-Pleurochrysis_carterae.AAC.1
MDQHSLAAAAAAAAAAVTTAVAACARRQRRQSAGASCVEGHPSLSDRRPLLLRSLVVARGRQRCRRREACGGERRRERVRGRERALRAARGEGESDVPAVVGGARDTHGARVVSARARTRGRTVRCVPLRRTRKPTEPSERVAAGVMS